MKTKIRARTRALGLCLTAASSACLAQAPAPVLDATEALRSSAQTPSAAVPSARPSAVRIAGGQGAWTGALDFQISPGTVKANRDWPTTVAVSLQEQTLVVSVNATDPQPSRIYAQIGPHDTVVGGDYVVLHVDAEAAGRRSYAFRVNASGSTADLIASSTEAGSPMWNGQWTGKATPTEQGYRVDYRIPLSTMGVRADAAGTAVRLNVERAIGRLDTPVLSLAPIELQLPCSQCQMRDFLLVAEGDGSNTQESVQDTAKWSIRPYVAALSNAGVAASSSARDAYAGVDASWRLGQRHEALLAIHPDYLQLDIDPFTITTNRRFATSLSENRPFFTHDPGFYDVGALPLLYTRLVTDVQAAAQYLYKTPERSGGILVANDRLTSYVKADSQSSQLVVLDQPSTTALARATFGEIGFARPGVMGAYRKSDDLSAGVISADVELTPSPEHRWLAQGAASSFVDRQSGDPSRTGHAVYLSHQFGKDEWAAGTTFSEVSAGFQSPLGKIDQVGVRQLSSSASWNKRFDKSPDDAGLIVGTQIAGSALGMQRTSDSQIIQRQLSLLGGISFKGGHSLDLTYARGMVRYEDVPLPSSVLLLGLTYKINDKGVVLGSVSLGKSQDYFLLTEGKFRSIDVLWSQAFTSRLNTRLSLTAEQLRHDNGNGYDAAVASLQVTYAFNDRHQMRFRQLLSHTTSRDVVSGSVDRYDQRSSRSQFVYTYKPAKTWSIVAGWRQGTSRSTDVAASKGSTAFIKGSYEFSN